MVGSTHKTTTNYCHFPTSTTTESRTKPEGFQVNSIMANRGAPYAPLMMQGRKMPGVSQHGTQHPFLDVGLGLLRGSPGLPEAPRLGPPPHPGGGEFGPLPQNGRGRSSVGFGSVWGISPQSPQCMGMSIVLKRPPRISGFLQDRPRPKVAAWSVLGVCKALGRVSRNPFRAGL